VRVRVSARVGAPLETVWTLVDRPDISATATSTEPLVAARAQSLSLDQARDQLGRLGNTHYELAEVELDVLGQPFVSASLLNQLRRQAVERLAELQSLPRPSEVRDPLAELERILPAQAPSGRAPPPQLHLLVRTPEQLEAALAARPASITLDYLDLYGLRPAVERVRSAGIVARVASPRILKPNEQRIVHFLLRLECDILVRSSGLLLALIGDSDPAGLDLREPRPGRANPQDLPKMIGDFSLNVANAVSASVYLGLGLARITPTHDLNAAQVAGLARGVGADKLEAVAYQHLPVFHTEHCVFCRFLSAGSSYKDCGHPCETRRVALRDASGRAHPVLADVGCRNTVFGAEAQEASRHLDDWLAAGIRHYRLEFVHETGPQVAAVAGAFADALAGRLPARELARRLARGAPQGLTEGSLFVPA
jgi:putative protease